MKIYIYFVTYYFLYFTSNVNSFCPHKPQSKILDLCCPGGFNLKPYNLVTYTQADNVYWVVTFAQNLAWHVASVIILDGQLYAVLKVSFMT